MRFLLPFSIALLLISCDKDIQPPLAEISNDSVYDTLIYVEPGVEAETIINSLCVIVDFKDTRFENSPDGLNSLDSLAVVLKEMSKHWAWMSQGKETFRWTISRIELRQKLATRSFEGWWAFRDTVAIRGAAGVDRNDYDFNSDGILDVMWAITSSRDKEMDYLIGGASEHMNTKIFVDGQASMSIKHGAIGNFNHEIGHLRGLPDLYGEMDNIKYLSLMSDSWPVPPFAFCAYDRYKMGWLTPLDLSETQKNISLSPNESSMDCIRLKTGNSSEYFLIEYRKKPGSGYASLLDDHHPHYDGIAVYHVNENDYYPQQTLIRLITADGEDHIEDFLAGSALWHPGNSSMPDTCKLMLYDGSYSGYSLANFQARGESISLDILCED